ncbi:MAG TPA: amino acid adenylation domain-containing protein [Candidatus Limnocylindrales bacterium]|nr:amino acid adenylation domain-containing protein [Candidatus Limnocylindrales bacterium]
MSADVFVLPTSFGQDRLWLLHQLVPAGTAYHLAAGVRLSGPLEVNLLRQGINQVVARHEPLRTTFGLGDSGRLVQLVHDGMTVDLPLWDLLGQMPFATPAEREAQARDRAAALALRPFDLACGPLLRIELMRLAPRDHWLIFVAHHIVVDGTSLGLLLHELGECYRAGQAGEPPDLPELRIQYADWAAWQRELVSGAQGAPSLDYWRERLHGAEAARLPTEQSRPLVPRMRGAQLPIVIDADLAERVRALARQERCTPFMALAAAHALVWSRWSGQDDLVLGAPVAGRTVRDAESLVGHFVNTLPLRLDLSNAPSFRGLLAQTRQVCLGAYAHQRVPFERLVELVNHARDGGREPLVQTMLVMRPALTPRWSGVEDLVLEPLRVPVEGTQLDLQVYLDQAESGAWTGEMVYDRELFDGTMMEAMGASLTTVLASAVAEPDAPVRRLAFLSTAARHALAVERSGAGVAAVATGLLHNAFEAAAATSPHATALVDDTCRVTYAELDHRANQLAHHLLRNGVGRGDLVGICIPRSASMVVAVLAVLKAGAAYLPLDPRDPAQRLRFMVSDSGARVVLTELDTLAAALATMPDTPPRADLTPGELAYMVYISDSTGRPKGALNQHGAVSNRIAWMQREYPLDARDTVLPTAPLDVSGRGVHWPLAAGARLVLPRLDGDPDYLAELIVEQGVTTVHFVPSMLGAFLAAPHVGDCSPVLRRIVCSGEELTRGLAERCLRTLPGTELYNLYGPTEAASDVTASRVKAGMPGRVPIGRPIAGAHAFVFAPDGELSPPGATGELYLGGVAVGRGYHARPALTAQRFVPDPFGSGGRLYRTGDLVRWRADGELEFLGRLDRQVKLRGYRIEIEEIETVLARHPGVGAAAVVPVTDAAGETHLVAYLTEVVDPLSDAEVRGFLRARLPEAMVPGIVTVLPELPLSSNGKLDRARLPKPLRDHVPRPAGGSDPAPRPAGGRAEEVLVRIWSEVLGLERIGVDDDFYDLGGNSLSAVTVLTRARDEGLSVQIATLLGRHTIRDLAAGSQAA